MRGVDLPAELVVATREGRCVLFVGSGLSVSAGYPSWTDLVNHLVIEAKKLPHARTGGLERIVEAGNLLSLAEFAQSTLGPARYAALLQREFGKATAMTPAHKVIAGTAYRGVITTNYDRLLETAWTLEQRWSPQVLSPESVSGLGAALSARDPFIFKLHGDVSSPSSIILTEFDYDRMILQNPHARTFLQAVFLNYTVLFVGYSLRDPDLRLVLKELVLIFGGSTPVHYALAPDPAEFEVAQLMERMNIQVIPYGPVDGHRQLLSVLEELQRAAPRKSITGAMAAP